MTRRSKGVAVELPSSETVDSATRRSLRSDCRAEAPEESVLLLLFLRRGDLDLREFD